MSGTYSATVELVTQTYTPPPVTTIKQILVGVSGSYGFRGFNSNDGGMNNPNAIVIGKYDRTPQRIEGSIIGSKAEFKKLLDGLTELGKQAGLL